MTLKSFLHIDIRYFNTLTSLSIAVLKETYLSDNFWIKLTCCQLNGTAMTSWWDATSYIYMQKDSNVMGGLSVSTIIGTPPTTWNFSKQIKWKFQAQIKSLKSRKDMSYVLCPMTNDQCPISETIILLRTPSTWAWHWSSSYLFQLCLICAGCDKMNDAFFMQYKIGWSYS